MSLKDRKSAKRLHKLSKGIFAEERQNNLSVLVLKTPIEPQCFRCVQISHRVLANLVTNNINYIFTMVSQCRYTVSLIHYLFCLWSNFMSFKPLLCNTILIFLISNIGMDISKQSTHWAHQSTFKCTALRASLKE